MEAKYYKDYDHNYMILESPDIEKRGTYQNRMLASNKIDGLLKCSIRDVNGAVYFYYDISSKVSIENLYKGKQLSYEQTKDFFIQMDTIYRNLAKFFMDEKGLLVRPDCIYYDLRLKKYYGLYFPNKEDQTWQPYEELMDFLLSHIDTGNQKLVDSIYQIYEMSENSNFLFTDAINVFDEPETIVSNVHNIIDGDSNKEKYMVDGLESVPESLSASDEDYFGEAVKQSHTKIKKGNDVSSKGRNSVKYYGVFMIISLFGICAAGFIYFNYKLTEQEFMMVICCIALMSLCFVFSAIQLTLSGKKEKDKDKEEWELLDDIEDEFRDEKPIALQGVLDKNVGVNVNLNMNANNNITANKFSQSETVDQNYGETVFIDTRKQNTEYKLYALDKKNKKHIELTRFPFTIGKMAGCVDCVLTDDSISRLHARIEMQDERIFLTDMNSTNGTYKNGLRMEPSETVELEPGDEIRFGKLNYCYR